MDESGVFAAFMVFSEQKPIIFDFEKSPAGVVIIFGSAHTSKPLRKPVGGV
jgi:hypothetical protein